MKEQEEAIKLEDEVAQKIAACVFSQHYLSQLVPQVYKKLETEGYLDTEDPDIRGSYFKLLYYWKVAYFKKSHVRYMKFLRKKDKMV